MREMGIAPECQECVMNQARSAAKFAQLDATQSEQIFALVRQSIEEAKTRPLLVQHIVRRVADTIISLKSEDPDFDIYSEVKNTSNRISLQYAINFQRRIDESDSPLETGLQIAAAGNIIDFGAKSHGSIDLDKELELLDKVPFARYDWEAFKSQLDRAQTLLYICDNSGEIVFDMVFIKELLRHYPKLKIVAAFREKPIINDATLKDAHEVGMDDVVEVISSGSIYPGTILKETSPEFQELFEHSDLILSKGQGNFETLLPEAKENLFFLLRIKCNYMANLAKVEKGKLLLMQSTTLPTSKD